MPAVLLTPFSYEERLFDGMEPAGRASPGFGDIRIANGAPRDGTGWLDDRLHHGWDGRDLLLYRGEKADAFADFELVARLTCDGLEWDEDTVTLRLRSRQGLFDRVLDGPVYGGTGGADGDSELAGRRVPQSYGLVFNAAPPLVDATNLVYQVHDRQLRTGVVFLVRDNGVDLTTDADYASYDALVGATIAAGEVATCLAEGLFRLGSSPAGQITVEIYGDQSPEYGWADSTAEIVRVLITQRMGGAGFVDPDELDTAAFDALIADQIGYWTGTEAVTVGDVLDQLMAAVGGYWRVRLDGVFTLGQLLAPSGAADHTIDASAILSIAREHYMPSWRQTITYQKNWSPQPADGLAGALDASRRQLYSQPHLSTAPVADPIVQTTHRMARDVETETFFSLNLATETARRQALYGAERDMWVVELVGDPFGYELGQLVDITGVTRFGWSDPKKLRIAGRAVDDPGDGFTARITLRLWG